MPQYRLETSLTVSLKSHPGVINQRSLGERCVAGAIWQFESDWGRGPLARLNLSDLFFCMDAFVVTFEIMKPNQTANGYCKDRGFVGNAKVVVAGDDVTEGYSIVVCADFEDVVSVAHRMVERNSYSVAVVDSFGVNTTRSVSFIRLITFHAADRNIPTQVHLIDFHSHPQSFNDRGFLKSNPALQSRLVIQQLELQVAIRTNDPNTLCGVCR